MTGHTIRVTGVLPTTTKEARADRGRPHRRHGVTTEEKVGDDE